MSHEFRFEPPLRRLTAGARAAFGRWPAPVRALTLGTLLLVALLWVLCTGWLWWLLAYTWRTAFPGEGLRSDPAFLRALLGGAAVGLAVMAGLVFYRRTVYATDAVNYFAKQNLLFNSFSTSGFYGVSNLLENLLTADYKMFMNLFISLPYLFLPRNLNTFMVCYGLTCFVPMWTALDRKSVV